MPCTIISPEAILYEQGLTAGSCEIYSCLFTNFTYVDGLVLKVLAATSALSLSASFVEIEGSVVDLV